MDSRPRWVEALRRFVANTPPEPKLNLPASHPMFGTVRQLNPLRIALDNDPTTWLPYTPPCLDYPTRVGQRVWVETYDGRVVVVGVARGTPDLPVGSGGIWFGPIGKIPELPWMIADGAEISRADFPEAFALWGETFGSGNGSTTFNLPDSRGHTVVGADTSQSEFDTVGELGGSKTHTLTVDEMPSHEHDAEMVGIKPGSSTGWFGGFRMDSRWQGIAVGGTYDSYGLGRFFSGGKGGSQPHNNLQPYLVARYMVKVR